jgi:hypothetical protein
MRRPRLGTCSVLVIGRGQRGRPARTWRRLAGGLGPEPGGARGRHPSEGVVKPHFGVDRATGGLGCAVSRFWLWEEFQASRCRLLLDELPGW